MVAQNAKPQLKADTHYIPLPEGVYLRGNNSRLVLRGKSLYPLLEHLVPHLNGKVTLAELTEGLDAHRASMITNLLEKLFAHHLLRDASQDQPHSLRPAELETYAPDITFVDSFQSSAAARFALFREKHLLLIGSRTSIAALTQASTRSGVKRVSGILAPEAESAASPRQDVLLSFAGDAADQAAHLIDAPCWTDEASMRKTIQACDAVLHIAERPLFARARLLNRLCVEEQKPFIQAVVVDDQAWIGPLVSPESSGCWECAWRRRQAHLPSLTGDQPRDAFQDQPLVPASQFLGMPAATLIANRLVFELFKYLTQVASAEAGGRLSVLDLATLLSESHVFLPHPYCQACQHPAAPTASVFLAQLQQVQQQEPLDPDTLFERFAGCVDEKLGLFTAIDDDAFAQAPLAVYQVAIFNPLAGTRRSEPASIVAVGTDPTGARLRVIQQACEHYAANLVDRRRLLSSEALQDGALPVLSTEQLLGQQSSVPENEMWTWALDLRDQQACLVPAARAFPALRDPKSERGIASGMIWEEAICRALLDWCHFLTLAQLRDARQVYPRVDFASAPMTPEGRHLRQLLTTAVGPVTVYDVTGALSVPTFATCLAEKVIACTTHCDVATALCAGLEQVLQQFQSEQFQEPAYAVAPGPDLPLPLRGEQWSVPSNLAPDSWSDRQEWLLQRLQASGFQAYALPLNHDPALARVFPCLVRVLLTKAEPKGGA